MDAEINSLLKLLLILIFQSRTSCMLHAMVDYVWHNATIPVTIQSYPRYWGLALWILTHQVFQFRISHHRETVEIEREVNCTDR